MATIYFTNTTNSGTGSLRQALLDARDGDVIEPDPTVFSPGELVVVSVSAPFEANAAATLRSGAARLRLKRSAPGAATLFNVNAECSSFTVEDVEFIGRVIAYSASAIFKRCFFGGVAAVVDLVRAPRGGGVALYDCAVTGALGAGLSVVTSATIVRSTIAGNAANCALPPEATIVDSIVDPICSESGFVAPPPDVVPSDQGALPWEDWNLRLLPTSRYATGATTAAGEYDVLGNRRGRFDAATLAIGAYELVVADYYQASASSGSFNDPNDWTTDPGKTTASESTTSGVFYVDENATWRDAPPEGSTLIVAGRRVETFGADLALARLESGRNSTLVFSGEDRVVRASAARLGTGATLAAPSGSSGYLAVPSGVDVSGATFVGVAIAGFGAGLTSFSATSERSGRATLSWTAREGSETVRLERRVGAGSWDEIAAAVPASAGGYTSSIGNGRATFRAFDGERFWTDDAWSWVGVQFRVVASAVPGERVAQLWKAEATVVATSDSVKVGQGITILAKIVDAFDESALLLSDGSNVQSVAYSCFYVSNGLFDETLAPVADHENVVASNDCVLEAPQTSDAWTRDEIGYTFALTPDVRTAPLFEKPGEYRIKVVIRLTEGNPVTFYVPISVEES